MLGIGIGDGFGQGGTPIKSKYVEILKENINIIPDNQFNTAIFKVEYKINTLKNGIQIPLLFNFSQFKESYVIRIDNNEVKLQTVPIKKYSWESDSLFHDFNYLFDTNSNIGNDERVGIDWDNYNNGYISNLGSYDEISVLKYFKGYLTKGSHVINVEYNTKCNVDLSSWIKKYSFNYLLLPAKYRESNDSIEITLNASDCSKSITTNIGNPLKGDVKSIAKWHPSSLPNNSIEIIYIPEINLIGRIIFKLGMEGLGAILLFILFSFHLIAMIFYRKFKSNTGFSFVMLGGSLLVPLILMISLIYSYDIIYMFIGKEASGIARENGTFAGSFFSYFFNYLVYMVFYLIIMIPFDLIIQKIVGKKTNIQSEKIKRNE